MSLSEVGLQQAVSAWYAAGISELADKPPQVLGLMAQHLTPRPFQGNFKHETSFSIVF